MNQQAYYDYIKERESKTILVFCPEMYNKENNLNVRVFPIFYGVQEDPATGSGWVLPRIGEECLLRGRGN